VARKQDSQARKLRVVSIQNVASSDTEKRLSHTVAILLRAALRHTAPLERDTNSRNKLPSCQIFTDNEPAGGNERSD